MIASTPDWLARGAANADRPRRVGPLLVLVLFAATPAPALADDDPQGAPAEPPPADEDVTRARALFERGELAAARALLLRAYEQDPRPALLFALGQVELNLGRPQAAIDYYEKFIATGPSDDEVSLAQQAIGAARMQLSLKPPPPTPEPPKPKYRPPRWDVNGTRIALLGGIGVAAGAGLIFYARRLGGDQTGTLSEYDARIDRARIWQWTGAGVAAAGAIAIGAAIVRWRTSGGFEVVAAPTAGGASASLGARW